MGACRVDGRVVVVKDNEDTDRGPTERLVHGWQQLLLLEFCTPDAAPKSGPCILCDDDAASEPPRPNGVTNAIKRQFQGANMASFPNIVPPVNRSMPQPHVLGQPEMIAPVSQLPMPNTAVVEPPVLTTDGSFSNDRCLPGIQKPQRP